MTGHGLASTEVHALVGLDIPLPHAVVDAVDGTLVHAGSVVDVDAGLSDHERPPCLLRAVETTVSRPSSSTGQAAGRRRYEPAGHPSSCDDSFSSPLAIWRWIRAAGSVFGMGIGATVVV